jgi:hypothetical protein
MVNKTKGIIKSIRQDVSGTLPKFKLDRLEIELRNCMKPNTTLSFGEKYGKIKDIIFKITVIFFICTSISFSQDSSRVTINPDGITATIPIPLLYECYTAVIERDSALYRESVREENNNLLKYQLIDCNNRVAKLKKRNTLFIGGTGLIIIINLLKILL